MKKVEIAFVLDETGSMGPIAGDTVGSYNTFVEEQKKLKADVTFSLMLFSSIEGEETYRWMYKSVPMAGVQPLSDYRPRGTTPLLDAIGGTIDGLGNTLANMKEKDRPDQVIVVILTDGEENDSHEYTLEQIREKVTHQREKYNWEFIFLGCGINAYAAAQTYAMDVDLSHTSTHTAKGVRAAYAVTTETIMSLVED